ncbi:rsbT co-antagonist protein RsbR [Catenuloplanes nepalensis]|uniref:RsbT co-antagonist protein RsbR n=1 Tax=Catenuloplanes nepalensis TaxID=587533 RepID=A0ABT9N551_9ACTN|nr:STAS domain-containing protein [Catenuloplanes nepalensis]MDP9798806.1 rsbT co-antagonist protein RsbR [Catenuloplanes nepalensis]
MALSTEAAGRLAALLDEHQDKISELWVRQVAATLRGRLSQGELDRQVRELFRTLREVLAEGGAELRGGDGGEVRALLAEMSRSRALQGFTSTETAVSVFAVKEAFATAVDVYNTDSQTMADYIGFGSFIDDLGLFTFAAYAQAREEVIADQAEQLLELATPVVKLWDGVVAVPLVGTLDSARAQVVMERLLQTLVDTGSPYAIIDITGVPAVDTQVAQHVLKTVVAARLMGAECIISGIRPQIAQTIVALGIEFGDIATKATLADALRHALRRTGNDLARRGPARAEG